MAKMGGTVDDLAALENLSQETLEANLKARYDNNQIYTWCVTVVRDDVTTT